MSLVLAIVSVALLSGAVVLVRLRRGTLALVAVNLALPFLLLAAAEALLERFRHDWYRESWSEPPTEADSELGTHNRADAAIRHRRYPQAAGYRLAWDVTYHTEADGSRLVPGRPPSGPEVAFFGGSFVFGEGLPDEETLPALLQLRAPRCRVRNFAVRGHGTGQHALLLDRVLGRGFDPDLCILGFIPDHVRRTVVPTDLMSSDWGRDHPLVELRDGSLRCLGPARLRLPPARRLHVELRLHSRLYRRLTARPWHPEDDDWRHIGDLVVHMRDACARQGGGFLLVVLPQRLFNEPRGPEAPLSRWVESLAARGIDVLDVDAAFRDAATSGDVEVETMFFPDGHPTRSYNERAASWLARHWHVAKTCGATGVRP